MRLSLKWNPAYLFILVASACVVWLLVGCETLPQNTTPIDQSLFTDPVWQAQTLSDLALDIRCDGVQNFKAPCTGSEVNTRLTELSRYDHRLMQPLIDRAYALQPNWDGK